jgi:hypothetical protein
MLFNRQDFESEEQFSFITANQKWFKFLAFVSFFCALFINAALVWLLCCRANRLPQTDMQLKQDAAFKRYVKKKRRSCSQKKRLNFKKKLKYLIFGNLKVKSPPSSFYESGSSDEDYEETRSSKKKGGGFFGFGKNKKNKSHNDSFI